MEFRVRIFTPRRELPFAGHPTPGSAFAWLSDQDGSAPEVVQQCEAGLEAVIRGWGAQPT